MSKYLSVTTTTDEDMWINVDNIVSVSVNNKVANVIDILTNASD